jgi:hypothetical protein
MLRSKLISVLVVLGARICARSVAQAWTSEGSTEASRRLPSVVPAM